MLVRECGAKRAGVFILLGFRIRMENACGAFSTLLDGIPRLELAMATSYTPAVFWQNLNSKH